MEKINDEELGNLYPSPNIKVIKLRRIGWVGYLARIGVINVYKTLLKRRDHLGDVDGKKIFK
jgi:hypothetical protein